MKGVVFDFGNVIAFFDHRRACRQLAALSASGVTEEEVFQAVFGTPLESDFDCGRLSPPAFIQRLRILLQLVGSDDAIVAAWCDIFWPNEEVASLIPRLNKATHRLLLASNTNELHYQWFRRRFAEPLARFDGLVLSHQLGFRKPAPEFFRRCVEVSLLSPQDSVYIDDRPDFVDAARTIGMRGIVYEPGLGLSEALQAEGVEVL